MPVKIYHRGINLQGSDNYSSKSILMSSISDSTGNDESKTAAVAIGNDQTPHLHNITDESEKPNEGK